LTCKEYFMARKKLLCIGAACLCMALLIASCSLSGAEPARKIISKPYISIQPESHSYYTSDFGDKPELVYSAPPRLEITIFDWNSGDGSLSYQWYSFATIDDYCANNGTQIAGATGGNYTPTGIIAQKGNKYYYYATVTNTNSNALEETSSTIQSDIAVISFSDPGEPLAPIITRSPSNAAYRWGAPFNQMQVKAVAPEGKGSDGRDRPLSYQWYYNPVYSVTGGTAVPLANQNTLIPDPDMVELGDNFFYAIVSNETAQTWTIPAKVTIDLGKKAAAPRISAQPKDQLIFTGGTPMPLVIKADSLDRGDLSYQWYINTAASVNGGTAAPGTNTEASYTPNINTATAGAVNYYYAEITNTNNVVEGDRTASIKTKVVKVQVGSDSGAAGLTPNAFFIIPDPKGTHLEGALGEEKVISNTFQYIRGYGGMDVAWGNFPRTSQADTELMYDPERLGYNMLRIMIKANYVDPARTIEELLTGDRPDYIENVKIVNKHGGFVEACPWTPPKEWKSNNSINGGGVLIPSYYKLFATYLRNFAQYMGDNGAPIHTICISNEPNYVAGYDGCEWTGAEMRDFFLEVGHFTDGIRGYGGGKETPYVLTMNGASANTPYINLPALQNPLSKAAIDVLARHIYGERDVSLWNSQKPLITKTDAMGNEVFMEVWMNEHNINSANPTGYYNDSKWDYVWRFLNDVDLVIRLNNENAFVWWASKRFYSMVGDDQFGTTDGAPLARGWALTHYARYTTDYSRIWIDLDPAFASTTANGTRIPILNTPSSVVNRKVNDLDNTAPSITAFVSPDGEAISMVLWTPTTPSNTYGYDMGTIQVKLPWKASGVSAHRSWGQNSDQIFRVENEKVKLSPDREYAYITLGRSEIMSVKFTK
jgi:O-glycosyl hydrolase